MDAGTLARATDPFFTTKGIGKGTGLGLSMVHGLAEQSGGRLVLKSKLGEGTAAELWLPAAGPESQTMGGRAETAEPARHDDARPLVILAVDDDVLVLMNTTALLEDLGHRVFEANSGSEALGIFQREKTIDLVISDQAMPNMTGTQLAEAIKAERPELPFILATGYAELPPDVPPNLIKLSKPFFQAQLVKAVELALKASHEIASS